MIEAPSEADVRRIYGKLTKKRDGVDKSDGVYVIIPLDDTKKDTTEGTKPLPGMRKVRNSGNDTSKNGPVGGSADNAQPSVGKGMLGSGRKTEIDGRVFGTNYDDAVENQIREGGSDMYDNLAKIDKARWSKRTTRLAPNGKRSNLTDRQYDQVRTPQFKAWFGDWENDPANASKVVDENGEPLVVWHYGTFVLNGEYVPRRQMHFGTYKAAEYRHDVQNELEPTNGLYGAYFLNIKNPAETLDDTQPIDFDYTDKSNRFNNDYSSEGYDGNVYENHVEDYGSKSWVTYSSTQVKSATDNNGDFSPTNPDIRWSKVTPAEDAAYTDAVKRGTEYANARTEKLAPNGKRSNLSNALYHLVRTERFKKWFGDWERAVRVNKLRNSDSIDFKWNGEYDLNRHAARSWALKNLRKGYINEDAGDEIGAFRDELRKVTSHGTHDEDHLKSIAAIPEIIKRSIFIDERPNEKSKHDYDSFRYYVAGINIDGIPYTVKMVVGVKNGKKYYDHDLTKIEKGTLIDRLSNRPRAGKENSLDVGYDTKLHDLLQVDDVSAAIDENGEPLVVWHGGEFTNDGNYIPNPIMHFGTIKAAADRKWGVDYVNTIKQDDGWHWITTEDGDVGEKGYPSQDNALQEFMGSDAHAYFLNIRNPADTEDRLEDPEFDKENGINSLLANDVHEGYDGNQYMNNIEDAGSTSWVAYSPSQIKSADPMTYDDAGNVIPLSERFNAEKDDIRWSKRSKFRSNPLAQHMADFLKDSVGANEHANARAAKIRINENAKWMKS